MDAGPFRYLPKEITRVHFCDIFFSRSHVAALFSCNVSQVSLIDPSRIVLSTFTRAMADTGFKKGTRIFKLTDFRLCFIFKNVKCSGKREELLPNLRVKLIVSTSLKIQWSSCISLTSGSTPYVARLLIPKANRILSIETVFEA